jgi:rubredoxin
LRIVGIRALLCDNCNYPFRAFSPLPPKSRRPQHSKRKADVFNPAPVIDLNAMRQNLPVENIGNVENVEQTEIIEQPEVPNLPDVFAALEPKTEKPELRLVTPSLEKFDFAVATSSPQTKPQAKIVTDYIAPVRNDLRTEITRLTAQRPTPLPISPMATSAQKPQIQSSQICPECSSQNVKRRHRNFLERTVLSFTEHKAYNCRQCGASFYAKREGQEALSATTDSNTSTILESSCFNAERNGTE